MLLLLIAMQIFFFNVNKPIDLTLVLDMVKFSLSYILTVKFLIEKKKKKNENSSTRDNYKRRINSRNNRFSPPSNYQRDIDPITS